MDWEKWRAEFPIFEHTIYYNSCSLGALARRVHTALGDAAAAWHENGSAAWSGPWWAEMDRLRRRYATVIGARPHEIALFPNVTSALAAVASCFPYRDRTAVVTADVDFPTVPYQWLNRAGVEVRFVRSPDGLGVPVELWERAIDGRAQVIATSHVFFQSGVIQDVGAIARVAHDHGALALIDGYHAAGQLPVDVKALGVDFYVTGGLKWLIGGTGIAYLYVREDLVPHLRPASVGWFAHRDQFAFRTTEFEYADDARRLEGGTPSVPAIYTGSAGLEIILEIGPERLRERQVHLLADLHARLVEAGLRPRVSGSLERHAGLLSVPFPDPDRALRALLERGVIADRRPGVIRLSPYFYNTEDDAQRIADILGRIA